MGDGDYGAQVPALISSGVLLGLARLPRPAHPGARQHLRASQGRLLPKHLDFVGFDLRRTISKLLFSSYNSSEATLLKVCPRII